MTLILKLDANFLPITIFDSELAKESVGVFISTEFYTFYLKIKSIGSSIDQSRVCVLTLDIKIDDINKSTFIPYDDSFGFVTNTYVDLECVPEFKGPKCERFMPRETLSFYIYGIREFYHYYVQRIKGKFFDELFLRTWSFKFVNVNGEVVYDVISYHFIDFVVDCPDSRLDLDLHKYAQEEFTMLYSDPCIKPGPFLRVWLKGRDWFAYDAKRKRMGRHSEKRKDRIKRNKFYITGSNTEDKYERQRAGVLKLGPLDKGVGTFAPDEE